MVRPARGPWTLSGERSGERLEEHWTLTLRELGQGAAVDDLRVELAHLPAGDVP
jgi:hypothetical protein